MMSSVASVPLVCFPHAGAGRLYYSQWQTSLGAAVQLEVVQYPVRENRMYDPMPATVSELAEQICDEFAEVLAGEHALWGHSMGSVVAYEVLRACRRRGYRPPLVFFSSGSEAPCDSRFKPASSLDDDAGFRDILRKYGGVPESSLEDPDFMDYFAPVIRADLALLSTYQDERFEKIGCPLVLMEGRDDSAQVENWSRYVDREPECYMFDGGHFFLQEHRSVMSSLMSSRIQLAWQLDAATRTG